MKRFGYIVALLALLPALAFAFTPETPLSDPVQESRARTLFHELRCVVCAGESVAESPADVARDIRGVVRERIDKGENSDEIKAYLVSRYGDQILMNPRFGPRTYLLWFGPLLLLFLGGAIVFAYFSAGRIEKK